RFIEGFPQLGGTLDLQTAWNLPWITSQIA
ncbi:MAG: hypothetical protein ACI814_004030, partial [Mariniblastus sp.]